MQFSSAEHAVAVGVQAVFERWTALRLTVENQFGGGASHSAATDLLATTLAMATSASKRFDFDDYVSLFYETFDRLNTDIEDGSPEEVARVVLRIRDAAARGDFGPASEAAAAVRNSGDAARRSVRGQDSNNPSDDFDEGDGGGEGHGHGAPSARPGRLAPVVDDDGFTVVETRRR